MTTPNSWLPQAAAQSSTGRVRSGNEDAFGFCADHGIFVVCDGMGGAAGGEIASHMVVDRLVAAMCDGNSFTPGRDDLHDAIAQANHAVHERAESDSGLYGMGTTLVVLLLRPARGDSDASALVAHAGDSRCYLFRDGRLESLTHDHSLVDEQLRLGAMTREEAERSPFRSVITRAIGTQASVTEDVLEMPVRSGDLFLLCSDGLTREVADDRIAAVLRSERTLDDAVRRLVDAANQAGGHDNITCLLARVP